MKSGATPPVANTVRREKKTVFAFLYILLFPALILLLFGDLFWPAGWIFRIWFIILCYSTILYLYRKDPALLEERYRLPGSGNEASWDEYVVYGLVIGFTFWIVIMPLDGKRFGWSQRAFTGLSGTPCNLAGILMSAGAPLLLGSSYGLLASLVLTVLLMARIIKE